MEKNIYQTDLIKNNIKLDQAQEEILSSLTKFSQDLITTKNPPRGVYLFGNVGTGKTILMDLFFDHLKVGKKQKIHFHAFMLEIHGYLHKLSKSSVKNIDFVKYAAKYIAQQYKVIYIDELYIDDIADAMIVGRLFKELFSLKILVFITSNFAPEDLYKDGLQRENFLPFIEIIKTSTLVLKMDSNHDYRKEKVKSVEAIYYVCNQEMDSQKFIYDSFLKVTHNSNPVNKLLHVGERELICPITAGDCAVFTFDQLCRSPMGSSDYIKICEEFNIIILSDIPKLEPDEHNEAKRFIDLIDNIYGFKRILICTAKVEIEEIYKAGKWKFEFSRTVSRLHEMQSEEYISKLK